jgi:hypothetical protein
MLRRPAPRWVLAPTPHTRLDHLGRQVSRAHTPIVLRVAWFRFRATLRDRAGGYLTIVVLIALVGGIAMAGMAAAGSTHPRRDAVKIAPRSGDITGAARRTAGDP